MKAFFSYSHADAQALARLKVHLAQLMRDGKISAWSDLEIPPGGEIDQHVAAELESCDLFIPLVSPDFINSFYCYYKELARAIERQDAGELRIIPVVIEPCDWKGSPLKRFKALPKDGKPVSEYANPNNAYLEVATALRQIVEASQEAPARTAQPPQATNAPAPAKRYRAKKTFDAVDRQEFIAKTFAEIRKYVSASATELNTIEGFKARYTEAGQNVFSCTVVNRQLQGGTASITVYASAGRSSGLGDIYWSDQPDAPPNQANGQFRVDHDEYELFIEYSDWMSGDARRLTSKEAAEVLWDRLIEGAGISHD
jgi:hypothetical protein